MLYTVSYLAYFPGVVLEPLESRTLADSGNCKAGPARRLLLS